MQQSEALSYVPPGMTGLPFEVHDQIATLLLIRPADVSKAICMSPSTMALRVKAGRFITIESDRCVAGSLRVPYRFGLFKYNTGVVFVKLCIQHLCMYLKRLFCCVYLKHRPDGQYPSGHL